MSLCKDGLSVRTKGGMVTTIIEDSHPLIQLANLIDWKYLAKLAQPDLEKTARGFWWLGRKLNLRAHLGVMILQILFKWTDRATESAIKRTPIYQIFCGLNIIKRWRCPDHTKIEKFRNRLSPETYKKILDYIVRLAVDLGFADPSKLDVDSTVQEANISYPSDANLLKKLSLKCKKLLDFLNANGYLQGEIAINIKAIIKKSQEYFFLSKNTLAEKRRQIFAKYYALVKSELMPLIHFVESLPEQVVEEFPWNYRDAVLEIAEKAWRYLLDVAHFIRTNTIKRGKVLSFKMEDVICVVKGKAGKACEFGRVFQVGRIAGNFLKCYTSTSLRMGDQESLIPILMEHQNIFGEGVLKSVTTDKGYYSHENVKYVERITGDADGIQRPVNVKNQVEGHRKEELFNRRAGVEPLIGHAKQYGLRRSRMKSDKATLSSGYRSITGFNLQQLIRRLESGVLPQTA